MPVMPDALIAKAASGTESYQPDANRRYAELLVEAGLQTRREVEVALREARRVQQSLAQWLIRNHRIPSRYLPALRRLEILLARQSGGPRLSELLVQSGEMTRSELRRMLAIRERSGQSLADILIQQGWPGRPRVNRQRSMLPPLATAATLAVVSVSTWAMAYPHWRGTTPLSLTSQAQQGLSLQKPVKSTADLRFASLGDITPHLKRLRTRPAPYRKPPTLTGTTRQRIRKLRPFVNEYAKRYSLPPALILAVIEQESSFDPMAQSNKQGIGLMQLVPMEGGREAYRYSERKQGVPSLQELQDPRTNIRLGTAYLRLLLDNHFDDIENEDVRVALALAAYNWGPTRLRRVLRQTGLPATLDEVEALLETHAPVETRDYVREITDRMQAYG
jgi:soluble lytic murein transglycosylase-like protein